MSVEQTLVLVKPHAVIKGWEDDIEKCYTDTGLEIIERYDLAMTPEQAGVFYAEHTGKPFFAGLIKSMSSGKCRALVIEGEGAIARVRARNGATDPAKAGAETIRGGKFKGAGGPENTVHGSANAEDAEREIFFVRQYGKKRLQGELEAFAETGTEGFIWMLYKNGFEDAKGMRSYDGLENIEQGDNLVIYGASGEIVFDGIIDPDVEAGWTEFPALKGHGQPTALGCWIHWTQRGWNPDDWARMFFDKLRAELIKKSEAG